AERLEREDPLRDVVDDPARVGAADDLDAADGEHGVTDRHAEPRRELLVGRNLVRLEVLARDALSGLAREGLDRAEAVEAVGDGPVPRQHGRADSLADADETGAATPVQRRPDRDARHAV